ncbi:unnamed protein product [Gordionus sp. m RMFG-2023]|uniref:tRNA dimethylallyltransferase-like n=1 Tax=Gordionus sp. m RMFG-2023 TaxID=3053472 RepID=UPI0030DE9EC7
MESNLPIVVIIGPTAVGKSRLALELAQHFQGEIINSDSMQLYKGLDIVTNKISQADKELVKHHMLDVLDPLTDIYTVSEYKKNAKPIIHSLMYDACKIPFIVGGTNYYIESVLWDYLLDSKKSEKIIDKDFINRLDILLDKYNSKKGDKCLKFDPFNVLNNVNIHSVPTPELYDLLKQIDFDRSTSIHPNERRKIIRNLQIYEQCGQKPSDLILKQKGKHNLNSVSGKLIYPNSIMFWLDCDIEILKRRIDKRVDQMINMGLIDELRDFYHKLNDHPLKHDIITNNKGVFQNIGLKEFVKYIETDCTNESIMQKCIENLKLVTLKYAKRQNKWIKGRFLKRRNVIDMPFIYNLDTTKVQNDLDWYNAIYEPALKIVKTHLNPCNIDYGNKYIKLSGSSSSPIDKMSNSEWTQNNVSTTHMYECQKCQKFIVGDTSWMSHLKSKAHKFKQVS